MHSILAVFNIAALPAPRMVRSDCYARRPVVLKYFAFRDHLRLLAQVQRYTLSPVLVIHFHLPMPASWPLKKQTFFNGKPHQQTPDIDNLCKSFMDSLCTQDSFVHTISALKVWSFDPKIIVYSNE